MALFGSGKSNDRDFATLCDRVKTRGYTDERDLLQLLQQILTHSEARPKKILWMLTSPNPVIRDKSLHVIQTKLGRSACEFLIQAMGACDLNSRRSIAKEVAKLDPREVSRTIANLSMSKNSAERLIAFEIIGEHPGWHSFQQQITRGLVDPEAAVRHAATRVLARGSRNPNVRLKLLELLGSEDRLQCFEAVEALAKHPKVDLIEPFFANMSHVDGRTRSLMTDVLSRLALDPNANMEEHILPVLADENPQMRDAAVRLLAKMPDRRRVLRAYFLHSKGLATWLRSRTTTSILKIASDLKQPLGELLQDDDTDVRVGAMMMIAEVQDNSFTPVLLRILQSDEDWWIRSIAVDVLARDATPEVVDVLLQNLQDQDLLYAVLAALGRIDGPKTLPPLLHFIKDPSRGIRVAALQALGNKPSDQVANHIFELAKHDPERKVRDLAESILLAFEGGRTYAEALQEQADQQTAGDDDDFVELKMVNEDLNK